MTLSLEMSRITRAFGEAHTNRTKQISELRQSLHRQLAEGRTSMRRASAALSETIERDLKGISRHVAATRSAASGLIKRYKVGRQANARALRAKLGTDRSGLTAMVNRFKIDLNRDRAGAKRIFQEYAVSRKAGAKQSASTFNRAAVVAPAVETVKSTSVAGAPAAVIAPKN